MKTVPFSDILGQSCQLIGLDRATLNDKSFTAIRDMTSRRISTIWDREEWPDTERRIRTWPGNPIQAVQITGNAILMESGVEIDMESGIEILVDEATENTPIATLRIYLDVNFPRVYLADFENDAYKLGKIESTEIKFLNPFYLLMPDGTRTSIATKQYKFTYSYATDDIGKYIEYVDIVVDFCTPEYPSEYAGPNAPLTSKIVFLANKNYLVQLEDGQLEGLEAYSEDPRLTTRTKFESFLVEDFSDRNDTVENGYNWQQELSYLRFLNDGEKFIRYRQSCPRLTGSKYSEFASYGIGAQAFYDPTQGSSSYNPTSTNLAVRGDFWNVFSVPPIATAPANKSQYWKMVQIPYRFKDFLINGVTADFFRSEGRADEANVFDALAETAIEQQIDVLIRQQAQVQRMNMAYTY